MYEVHDPTLRYRRSDLRPSLNDPGSENTEAGHDIIAVNLELCSSRGEKESSDQHLDSGLAGVPSHTTGIGRASMYFCIPLTQHHTGLNLRR